VVDNRQWGQVEDCAEDRASFKRVFNRQFRGLAIAHKLSPFFLRTQVLPTWVFWSLAANGVLALVVGISLWRQAGLPAPTRLSNPAQAAAVPFESSRRLDYQQSLGQLNDDAQLVAVLKPKHLAILVGDSISLRFPPGKLSEYRVLNQGISGETTAGLLKRLNVFDQTQPDVIFVMIGVNDLLRGRSDSEILEDQRRVIETLKAAHPEAKIVMQSILPHAVEQVTWEGRDRLLAIPNHRIKALNEAVEAIALTESVDFFNLYSLFANSEGNLRRELSSDGLHLSTQGYEVWGIALQVYGEEVLKQK
jgi:lysophospholipase L1-like esterase